MNNENRLAFVNRLQTYSVEIYSAINKHKQTLTPEKIGAFTISWTNVFENFKYRNGNKLFWKTKNIKAHSNSKSSKNLWPSTSMWTEKKQCCHTITYFNDNSIIIKFLNWQQILHYQRPSVTQIVKLTI